MNIFKVSCVSDCGSYFGSYLQSVTVVADTKEDALTVVKECMKKTGNKFIYPETRIKKDLYKREYIKTWDVFLVAGNIQNNTVIDTFEDSDY
jgi:hypothetical protein